MKRSNAVTRPSAPCLLGMCLIMLALSCGTPQQDESPSTAEATTEMQSQKLTDRGWKLVSITGDGDDLTPSAGVESTLVFASEGQIAGSGGCNRYFSAVELGESGEMSVGPIGSTMMACAEEVMAQEQRFLQALERTTAYRVLGDRLELSFAADGVLAFEATAIPES